MKKAIFIVVLVILAIAIAGGYRGGAKDAASNYGNVMRNR